MNVRHTELILALRSDSPTVHDHASLAELFATASIMADADTSPLPSLGWGAEYDAARFVFVRFTWDRLLNPMVTHTGGVAA